MCAESEWKPVASGLVLLVWTLITCFCFLHMIVSGSAGITVYTLSPSGFTLNGHFSLFLDLTDLQACLLTLWLFLLIAWWILCKCFLVASGVKESRLLSSHTKSISVWVFIWPNIKAARITKDKIFFSSVGRSTLILYLSNSTNTTHTFKTLLK